MRTIGHTLCIMLCGTDANIEKNKTDPNIAKRILESRLSLLSRPLDASGVNVNVITKVRYKTKAKNAVLATYVFLNK